MKRFKGTVIHGDKTGRTIGFPTLNINTDSNFQKRLIDIIHGVYTCQVWHKENMYLGVAHYGPRLVQNEQIPLLEIHLFNFNQVLYDEEVDFKLLDFIRPTMKFENLEAAKKQIQNDAETAKVLLGLKN